jgi:hypothetical protein
MIFGKVRDLFGRLDDDVISMLDDARLERSRTLATMWVISFQVPQTKYLLLSSCWFGFRQLAEERVIIVLRLSSIIY